MEYLEKLQGKMNLDEVVDKNKVIEYGESYDKYNGLSTMFGFISIAVALSSWRYHRYLYHLIPKLVQ